ncbi:unnamed protein product [Nippostrongylus brasiliensis]|uniref:CCHC-type domain-containing protein n=1 Tax=Nippostrongylus brasiliensis TaxID=27835 RepID=A0A0N4YEN6_NIPBR|nr:unnamed protein product [Nippostrongylus brasiliensis]
MKLDGMKETLSHFPQRKIRNHTHTTSCPAITCRFCNAVGKHYSDSCPVVTEAKRRVEIITTQGRCKICLGICGDHCQKRSSSKCRYCDEVCDTVYDHLIPKEEHHCALCPLPEMKEELEREMRHFERYVQDVYDRLSNKN